MNLANYAKYEQTGGRGQYVKFEATGDTKYFRFLYESGGERMGEDVVFYRKYWDDVQKKFIVGTEQGQLLASLKCIEYDEDGSNPRLVIWERSAFFCKNVLLPMWKNYPRIIDGVWKVTATSPKTKDASYSVFPVINADTIKYPIIQGEQTENTPEHLASNTYNKNTPQLPIDKPATPSAKGSGKKYWE